MVPVQTKASFMPCKARLSCHLVTFQQDSNFILLLFVYLVQRETRWHASCSKPLYGNGLKIAKTIKAKWRGKWWTSWSASHSSSVFKLSVLSVLSMGHLCERGPFYLQLQKLSINTKLGGADLGQLQDLKSEKSVIHLQLIYHLGNPKTPTGREREGRQEEEERKSSREEIPAPGALSADWQSTSGMRAGCDHTAAFLWQKQCKSFAHNAQWKNEPALHLLLDLPPPVSLKQPHYHFHHSLLCNKRRFHG